MSHYPERVEKDCLNCGREVMGRYCQNCGQENVLVKDSFFALVKHFIYDILHFDSKFFDTLKTLLFKPGSVSKLYVQGKRARFLDPIRMYLFTSAFFFFVFLGVLHPEKFFHFNIYNNTANGGQVGLQKSADSAMVRAQANQWEALLKQIPDSRKSYDSLQQTLPSQKHQNWLERRLTYKGIALKKKFSNSTESFTSSLAGLFFHNLPYLLFISLPFFAGILKLVYVRSRQLYFSDHAIFTLHLYIINFILLLVIFGVNALAEKTGAAFFDYIISLLWLWVFAYMVMAMKVFYGQSWRKTFFKALLILLLSTIVMVLLFLFYIFFIIIKI